ncbi:sugar-binding protein [Tautonia plasticadhaerens]|uniref:Carbohydrate-binding domain-containing protein n=1 Tax=Tautonia plasticadhaerens TaxID=2527974 RepID=A0A518GZU0_9BACT|nr:sugar-binding protein [Tautonia plasticadhaerens]QDV34094.1 hypothetical protein ElP_19760 [Tautonia plasticadhaerens]
MKQLAATVLVMAASALTTGAMARQEGPGPVERPSVSAPVLEGITIDGDLADWPDSMTIHSLDKLFNYDGSRQNFEDLEGTDLVEPDDLSAAFAVGYSPGEQLLYVAVIVRDDALIASSTSNMTTDAVELFVDGLRGDRQVAHREDIALPEIPVQQYIAIPGDGPVYGLPEPNNPVLTGGDVTQTKTRMAFHRDEDVTIYEWAIQVFDRYPDRPTTLEPGKRIGFDVSVADEDLEEGEVGPGGATQMNRLDWIYWGPQWNGVKHLNADLLGELVFEE